MVTKINEVLCRLFNIYPGEGKNAFLFALLGFIWAIGVTTALKFADALFLIHVGAQALPKVYILISCGMLGVATLLLYAFHHMNSYRIYLSVLCIGSLFYLAAFLLVYNNLITDSNYFWYALKIFGYFLFSVAITCFWSFIDQYHDLQDAKRLYTLFSAMIFIGATSTGTIMRMGFLSLEYVFLLIIGALLLAAGVVHKIKTTQQLVIHEDAETESGATSANNSLRYLIKSILSSRFTLYLMTANMLTQLLNICTEYNYMTTFSRYFSTGNGTAAHGEGTTASLTLFLGKCLALVGMSNLIIGLFIYSRLVRRFGVTSLIFITPVLLIIAFTGWSLTDTLLFPLIGFFVVEGTIYVIDDNNFNLLLNAVPSKLKYKIRVMIESFFEPIGMLISAIFLSILGENSKIAGIALAMCSLLVAAAMQSQYLKALFSNLAENAIHFQRTIRDWINTMTHKEQKVAESRLLAILKTGEESAQLFACEALLAFSDPAILKKLLTFASEMSQKDKIKFIHLLEQSIFAKDVLVLDFLKDWLSDDPDPQLKSTIYFYFAKQHLISLEEALANINSPDLYLQGSAIIILYTSSDKHRSLADQQLKRLLDSQNESHLIIGLKILSVNNSTNHIKTLMPYLKHTSVNIARTAAQSIAQIIEPQSSTYAPALISQLTLSSDNELRLACLKALGQINDPAFVMQIIQSSIHFRPSERRLTESIIYRMGPQIIPQLIALVQNTKMHDRCRLLAGRALGRISSAELRSHLTPILHHEIERAYFYFYHFHTVQEQHPNLDLSILKDTLWTGYLSVIDFIIQLLGVAGEVEDCELLSRCLRSRNPKTRSHVVEALEKTCENPIFRLIRPLVDDLPHQEKISAYIKGNRTPLSLSELLDKISESPAQVDQIIAATLKYRLNLPRWRETLNKQKASHDEIFYHFAAELLEQQVEI